MITPLHHRIRVAICAAIVLGLSGTAAPAIAQTTATDGTTAGQPYYVSCSSAPSGDGSKADPWRSLSAVNAHGAFAPGDQILFERGKTCTGRFNPRGSGTAAAPIVVGAYGSGARPLIKGGGTADGTGTIWLADVSYWTIQDLVVTNTVGGRSSSRYRAGVLIENKAGGTLRGMVVQRLLVENVASNMSTDRSNPREWGGIVVVSQTKAGARFSGVTIRNNVVSHVGRTGIIVTNRNWKKVMDTGVRVTGNKVSHPRGDGIVVLGSSGARIDHNTVDHANDAWPCQECRGISPATANAAIYTVFSKNVRIDHNEAYATKVKGGDGEGLDVDVSAVGTVVEDNYSHDNEGGGILLCGSKNAVVRFNIFENNKKSAIAFIGNYPAKNTAIYNNTIYSSAGSAARVVRYFNGAHGSGISFKNNVVFTYARGYGSYMWPTKVSTAANTLRGFQTSGRPQDSRTSYADPQLRKPGSGGNGMRTLNGYKPKHPSSFTRGVAIPKTATVDFFGKKVNPKKPPRGAAG